MYEWLYNELEEFKMKKFHVIEKIGGGATVEDVDWSQSIFPPSYLNFISHFGNSRLYKRGNHYQMGVFAPPHALKTISGLDLIYFGYFDGERVYFDWLSLDFGKETPIFEWVDDGLVEIAASFDQWLTQSSVIARNKYSQYEWETILNGAAPFNEKERKIIDAREHFRWNVLGFTKNGNVRILVKNESNITLPFLSLGVRENNGSLNGRLWLPVSDILPGNEKIIEHSCYNNLLSTDDIILYELPAPEIEDREQYWEFR